MVMVNYAKSTLRLIAMSKVIDYTGTLLIIYRMSDQAVDDDSYVMLWVDHVMTDSIYYNMF